MGVFVSPAVFLYRFIDAKLAEMTERFPTATGTRSGVVAGRWMQTLNEIFNAIARFPMCSMIDFLEGHQSHTFAERILCAGNREDQKED